jgi:hypothetical protein
VRNDPSVIVVFIPVVIVVTLVYFIVATASRRRLIRRLRPLAGDDYFFTFTSNGWYQAALLELQRQEVIDPKALTDDSNPITAGPRWMTASSTGLTIRRGYETEPIVVFPWAMVGEIAIESRTFRRNTRNQVTGLSLELHTTGGRVSPLLGSPNAGATVLTNRRQTGEIVDQITRLRPDPSTASLP